MTPREQLMAAFSDALDALDLLVEGNPDGDNQAQIRAFSTLAAVRDALLGWGNPSEDDTRWTASVIEQVVARANATQADADAQAEKR
jgi:hypothetical protein